MPCVDCKDSDQLQINQDFYRVVMDVAIARHVTDIYNKICAVILRQESNISLRNH